MEVKDETGGLDIVAVKSLDIFIWDSKAIKDLEDICKIAEIDVVAAKSLDVSVESLRDVRGLEGDLRLYKQIQLISSV